MIALGIVQAVDTDGVYVLLPGSKGQLRGPYETLQTVAVDERVLVVSTDDGDSVIAGTVGDGDSISVRAFGAKGDGTTDDTSSIQSAVTAAAGVASVMFPPGEYLITSRITVPALSTLTGEPGAQIVQQTAGAAGFRIVGSDVTIQGLTLTGRHATSTYVHGEDAIQTDTTVGSPLERIRVDRCVVTGWGKYGVWLEHVNGFWVTDCVIDQVGYSGATVCSCTDGQISGNRISNVTAGTSGNTYGIAASAVALDVNPQSSDISIVGNMLYNIAWEALDTHGGHRITFDRNTITACGRGVALVAGKNEAGDQTYAPIDCVVTNNTIDSLDDGGGAPAGVLVSGAGSGDTVVEYATGLIASNTIRRHGGGATISGVYLQYTRGFVVTGNVITECNRSGIALVLHNQQTVIASNAFVDVWSGAAFTAGVEVIASSSCMVIGNLLRAGTKSATMLNNAGIYDFGGAAAGNAVVAYGNDFAAAVTGAYVPNTTPADLRTPVGDTGGKIGFFGTAPAAKPTVTGSRGGNAALASLLTQLATLGLIVDSSS